MERVLKDTMKHVSMDAGLAVPCSTETRPSHFRKNVFRHQAKLGHFPREIESFLFVQRTNPKTRVTKVVPEVVYPIQANRPAVPKHAILEDDWRAFRSVFHNYQSLIRCQMEYGQRMLESIKCSDVASKIYNGLISRRRSQPAILIPTLAMYKDSVDAPLGYAYQRFKESNVVSKVETGPKSGRQQLKIPVLVFEGPFMDTVHISQGDHVKAKWDREMDYYDADVIVDGPRVHATYIYNEPDAIPISCAKTDFSQPLSQRAINMATSYGVRTSGKTAVSRPPNAIITKPHLPFPRVNE